MRCLPHELRRAAARLCFFPEEAYFLVQENPAPQETPVLTEKEARELLLRGELTPAPLNMEVVPDGVPSATGRADFLLDLTWGKERKRFVAEFKTVATPKKVEAAIREARSYAAEHPGCFPMVLVPHISEETAERLVAEEVSGLDFSGNVVVTAGEWLVHRTGQPNRFPSSQPIKNVYEGKSALVGRVLLSRPEYDLVKEVRQEIERRGGSISMGTVSKVLSTLDQDLIVRKNGGVRLIQPDRLLDRLASHYGGPYVKHVRAGKAPLKRPFFDALCAEASRAGVRIAGRSETAYVIAPTSGERTRIYVSKLGEWLGALPFQETDRFADVEFAEVADEAAFFDTQERDGFPWCSKLQIYLELAGGGKRERDAAAQLRDDLLDFQPA